ncbi:hypothetical protein BRADI_4g06371v3 [Brachypodium distachyon]|uniref:Uncharacterized protein n=1 Tax=Brachypodium distachyon TaxID=15368 RepID=A0A2K2CKU2_BRADI|nr:hypothetical protein BRADI_4g06371v3 [Brachypodium distachyon]
MSKHSSSKHSSAIIALDSGQLSRHLLRPLKPCSWPPSWPCPFPSSSAPHLPSSTIFFLTGQWCVSLLNGDAGGCEGKVHGVRRLFTRVGALESSGEARHTPACSARDAGGCGDEVHRPRGRGRDLRDRGQRSHCWTIVRVGNNHTPPRPCLQ